MIRNDLESYKFANKIWTDGIIVGKNIFETTFRMICFSIAPWIIGFLIATTCSMGSQYLKTPIFYIGSSGILITLIALIYGSTNQYKIYDKLLSCFVVSTEERRTYILSALERHSSFKAQLRSFLIVVFAGLFFCIGGFLFSEELAPISSFLKIYLPKFKSIDIYGWYRSDIELHSFSIIVIFLIFIAAPLGTSTSILLRLPIFILDVSKKSSKFPPSLIKMYYAPATSFYSIISLMWFIGASFIFYLFRSNSDWLSSLFIVSIFALGMVNFIAPQISYIKVASAAEDNFMGRIAEKFSVGHVHAIIERTENERVVIERSENSKVAELQLLTHLIKYDPWVYPVHQTYIVLVTSLISVVGSLYGWDKLISKFLQSIK